MNESSQETSNRVEITDEELISLTTAVKTRYGIDFTSYEKKITEAWICSINCEK